MDSAKVLFLGSDYEVRDEVFKLISHLHAQVLLISGEGLENFTNHNEEIKSNYLWSICDLAERSLALLSRLTPPGAVIKAE
jgi:hypothetical protein